MVRVGCPVKLHSDQGSKLISNLFCSLSSELGNQKTSTTPYHPQENGRIERRNRTIEECLSKYIGQYQQVSTKFLPLAIIPYRSSIHIVSKYSPAYLVLSFPLSLLIDCIHSTPQTTIYATSSHCVFTLKQKLQKMLH